MCTLKGTHLAGLVHSVEHTNLEAPQKGGFNWTLHGTKTSLLTEHAPSSAAEVLILGIRTWIDVCNAQIQKVRTISIVRRGGPIVAVAPPMFS